jgi:hypothetical protein
MSGVQVWPLLSERASAMRLSKAQWNAGAQSRAFFCNLVWLILQCRGAVVVLLVAVCGPRVRSLVAIQYTLQCGLLPVQPSIPKCDYCACSCACRSGVYRAPWAGCNCSRRESQGSARVWRCHYDSHSCTCGSALGCAAVLSQVRRARCCGGWKHVC